MCHIYPVTASSRSGLTLSWFIRSLLVISREKTELVPKKSKENEGSIRYKGIFLARTPFWCFLNVVIATMTLQKTILILTSNKNNINERHAK